MNLKSLNSLITLALLFSSLQLMANPKKECAEEIAELSKRKKDELYRPTRAGAIEPGYKNSLAAKRRQFREIMWELGDGRFGGIKWARYVAEEGVAKARYFRDWFIDGLVSISKRKYPILLMKDKALVLGKDKALHSVDLAGSYPGLVLKKLAGKEIKDDQKKALAEIETWMPNYKAIKQQIDALTDEYATLEQNKALIKKYRSQPGFATRGQAAQTINFIQYRTEMVNGVPIRVPYTKPKAFHDQPSVTEYLKKINSRLSELRGSTLPGFSATGEIRRRIIDQALLRERLDVLGRELRSVILDGEEALKAKAAGRSFDPEKLITQEEIDALKAARREIRLALKQDASTGNALLNKYDISEWAIKVVKRWEIVEEIKDLLIGEPFEFFQRTIGRGFVAIGDATGVTQAQDFGIRLRDGDAAKTKELLDEMLRPAQKRRLETVLSGPQRVHRMALQASGYGTLFFGGGYATGEAQDLYNAGIMFFADLHFKYFGSKDQCVNAEVEDLASYDHQADPKLFDLKIAELADDVDEDMKNLHEVIMTAMKKDEVFRLCLFNHYKLKYSEMIDGAKFFEEFDPFNPAVPSEYKNWFESFTDWLNPFDSDTSAEVTEDLYEEFVELFLRRYIYLRDEIIEDKTNQNIADTIEDLFERLANDPTVFHECGLVRDVEYGECVSDAIREISAFSELGITDRNALDGEAVMTLLDNREGFTEEQNETDFQQYLDLMDRIEESREIITSIVDVEENRVKKKKPRRRGRRGGSNDDKDDDD